MKVAVVVPWRAGDIDREKAWRWCEKWWSQFGWPVYVVEHAPPAPFNRSWCINEGARRAGDFDVLVAIDADVFAADPEQVRAGVKHAYETGRLTVPHTIGADLNRIGTDHLLNGGDDWQGHTSDVRDPCTSRITIVRADLFTKVGGFDERFQGWGFEDVGFWAACVVVNGADQLPGTAWHLWHTPSIQAARRTRNWQLGKRLADRYINAMLNGWVKVERLLDERTPTQRYVAGQTTSTAPHAPAVDVICLTAGRREYLERTVDSFENRVQGNFQRRVILDDSGDARFTIWLRRRFPEWEIHRTKGKVGFTQAIRAAWTLLRTSDGSPFVFHLEEDFVFDRPVDVGDMIALLENDPKLAQVALLRGAFYPPELKAGGIIQEDPGAYEHRNGNGPAHLIHKKFFTTNPCVYRRELLRMGWPNHRNSERVMTQNLVRRGYHFGFMGDGEPWVTHIGVERTMRGY